MTDPRAGHDYSPTARIASELIQFDTSNFGAGRANGEREAAHYLESQLSRLGLSPQLFESEPRRTSVIARVPGVDDSLPALVVHGHSDVVPAIAEQWSVDPFAGSIIDGVLWGRGAVDMKNMDAMIIQALTEMFAADQRPRRELIIAFFADEEAGGVLGSHFLVKNHPELFAGATEAISEVGGYSITLDQQRAYLIQTGEKALIWLTLTAQGQGGHGSQIHPDNAVTRLAEAVARLGRTQWPIHLTDTTSELISRLAIILGTDVERTGPEDIALATGTASRFISASLRATTNPTGLTAGYKHNVVPDVASAMIDVRVIPGTEDDVLAQIAEIVGDDITITVDHRDIGLETPFNTPIVDQMRDSLERFDPGAMILPYLLSGGTDNKALSELGIAGFGFAPLQLPGGFDFPAMFHGVDERVPVSALDFGTAVLKDFLLRY